VLEVPPTIRLCFCNRNNGWKRVLLAPPATSSSFGANILLSATGPVPLLNARCKFHTLTEFCAPSIIPYGPFLCTSLHVLRYWQDGHLFQRPHTSRHVSLRLTSGTTFCRAANRQRARTLYLLRAIMSAFHIIRKDAGSSPAWITGRHD
jgi:hypothetical protein